MNYLRKNNIAQCSLSNPLSKMNNKLIAILVIIKIVSGKELVFLSKSEPEFINIGLKYKELVIKAIID